MYCIYVNRSDPKINSRTFDKIAHGELVTLHFQIFLPVLIFQ